MVSTRMYIDTTDPEDVTLFDQFRTAQRVANEFSEYLDLRGCTEVHATLTKYYGILSLSWYPRRCNDADILEELKKLCNEQSLYYSENLKDLVEGHEDK